jgi:tetratricopeptide (TPR) repeat protein
VIIETLHQRIERCRQAAEREPDSAIARYNLGLAYTARGLVRPAEEAYRAALAIDPELVEAWVNLGGTLLLKWDFDAAAAALAEAVSRVPGLVEAHYNLGQVHLYRGDAGALESCCRRVIELQPEHAAAHYFLAVALLALGAIAEARASHGRALALGHHPLPEFLRRLEQAEGARAHAGPPPGAAASTGSEEN